jgi:DNA-binding CsgD family transcriptional regulator
MRKTGDPTLGRTLLPALNDRQRETLSRLMLGESEQLISWQMQITLFKLRCYIRHLYRVFGVKSRGELVSACVEIMRAHDRAQS